MSHSVEPAAAAAQSPSPLGPAPLGRLVRMRSLKPHQLPAHSDLAPAQSSGYPPALDAFVAEVLDEAERFMTAYLPRAFKVKSSRRESPPSAAPVELLSHEIRTADVPKEARTIGAVETWFARTSVHENVARKGSATWEEFDQGLRADHSLHEMEYTPDVYDAHKILDWSAELGSMQRKVGAWEEVDMSIVEMAHRIPTPLNDRVFPVLVLTARKPQDFVVVQIPVDTTDMANAKYHAKGKVTKGMYCSIEYGQLLDNAAKVKWQMATASDAKGSLPMWAQKLGVPGAVVKDVGLFIGWAAKRRDGKP